MAVLVGLQTTPLNYSQAFIADYTGRYYNRSVTNGSLTNCVDHSPFLSTLYRRLSPLAPDYSLATLGSRCLFSRQLLFHTLTLHSEIPLLKWARADGIVSTLCHRSYTQCASLVTGETSVVYFTWVATRCYGYEIRNQVFVEWQRHRFPGIRLH
jgi:hypothetical protein